MSGTGPNVQPPTYDQPWPSPTSPGVGPAGPPGMPGDTGEEGQEGLPGAPGMPGAGGVAGAAGAMGSPGLDGEEGWPGYDGAPGPQGTQGTQGLQGVMGAPGLDGEQGEEGTSGLPGPQGSTGAEGRIGPPGWMGLDGYDGQDGLDGLPGKDSIPVDSPMGEVFFNGNAVATVISTISTWTQVAIASTLSMMVEFDSPSAYVLRYLGTPGDAHMGCTLSLSCASPNNDILAVLVQNATVNGAGELTGGTILTAGIVDQKLAAAGDIASTALHVMTTLLQNDTLSLFVQNITGANDLTVIYSNMFALVPRGVQGTVGKDGLPGPQGLDGEEGLFGYDGMPGSIGPQGAQGQQGGMGPPGLDGWEGVDGLDGMPGPAGAAGSGGTITTAEADLGGDVTMTNANQYYDGPSVSLAAGTWFITGTLTVRAGAANCVLTAQLWDGTTTESSSETRMATSGAQYTISLSGIIVLAGTTTVKLSAASTAGGGSIFAAAFFNGVGNNASHIRAIKVA